MDEQHQIGEGTLIEDAETPDLTDFEKGVRSRFKKLDYVLFAIVSVLVVAVLTMLFTVSSMVIESFRFNSVVYREYSEKMEATEYLLETNRQLLEENRNLYQNQYEDLNELSTTTVGS